MVHLRPSRDKLELHVEKVYCQILNWHAWNLKEASQLNFEKMTTTVDEVFKNVD